MNHSVKRSMADGGGALLDMGGAPSPEAKARCEMRFLIARLLLPFRRLGLLHWPGPPVVVVYGDAPSPKLRRGQAVMRIEVSDAEVFEPWRS